MISVTVKSHPIFHTLFVENYSDLLSELCFPCRDDVNKVLSAQFERICSDDLCRSVKNALEDIRENCESHQYRQNSPIGNPDKDSYIMLDIDNMSSSTFEECLDRFEEDMKAYFKRKSSLE